MTYMGAGFLLIGMFVFLVSATNPSNLGIFLALGIIIVSMGLVPSELVSRMSRSFSNLANSYLGNYII